MQKMERKEKSESPPQLYDLTALQRDANRLLGFTAQQTLDYAQSLYEKRFITYPRTDSRFLTEDMAASLPGLVTATGKAFAVKEPISIHVQQVIDGSKVTDHHALLPTKSMANADLAALPAGERNILRLIAARLLCAVGELHRYAETTLTTLCAGEEFSAKGKVVLSEGWKAIERKMLGELLGKQKEPAVLPDVQERSQCSVSGAELKEGQTSPPKHFTEDTLLHAMETASADSMPEGVERQGIGTPATRAATIEKLVQKGFLERKGTKKTKVLLPTDKGKALITVMPEEIQSPEMTADWETKLLQIERSEMEPETFMTEIKEMISSLVTTTEAAKGANLPVPEAKFETVVVKPSEIQQDMVKSLSERAAEVHSGAVDPSVDNMLKITSDGRKIGLDQRLMNPLTPDDPDSKLNACVDNVLRIWNETKEDNLTQLIFCDMSTPKGDGSFNVYDDIRTKLLAAGVPESEVEFIHNADSTIFCFRESICAKSADTTGIGTQIKKHFSKMCSLHPLDAEHKGFGHSPTSILNLIFRNRIQKLQVGTSLHCLPQQCVLFVRNL